MIEVLMGRFAVVFLTVALHALAVGTVDGQIPDIPMELVIGIDSSGSMRPMFGQVVEKVDAVLDVVPEGTRLALVRFDEGAEEFARTNCLTGSQRETIRGRLHSLTATGRWTNFDAAVKQIHESAESLGTPVLIAIFTDALSDPGPAHPFESFDKLLHNTFADQENLSVLLIVPKQETASRIEERGPVHAAVLSDTSPEDILSYVPAQQLAEPGDTSSAFPATVGAAVTTLLLAVSAVCFICVRDWVQARRLRAGRRELLTPKGLSCDLIARCGGATLELGPVDEIEEVRIGTTPGCDIHLTSPEGQEGEVILRRESERFTVRNRSHLPVRIDGAELEPGRMARLRLPAELTVDGQAVLLLLLPRVEEIELEQEAEEHAAREVDDDNESE